MFSTYQPLAVYPADGVQTEFDAPDLFYDVEDVRAVVVIDGEETTAVRGVDFDVVIVGRENTPPFRQIGKLVFVVPPADGANVVPYLLPPSTQDQKFEGRPVSPRQHERVHDRGVMTVAMLLEFFNRSYRSPLDTPAALRFIVAGREGYVPTWDEDGNLIEGPTVAQVDTVAGFIDQVVIVAGIQAEVVAAAGLATEISGLYPVRVAIGQLGPVAGAIATLAPYTAELAAMAPYAAEVNLVGDNIASVVTVAGSVASVNTVAAINVQVQTVANMQIELLEIYANVDEIALVSQNLTPVATVADNIADVTTAAANIVAIQNAPTEAANAAASAAAAELSEETVAMASVPAGTIIMRFADLLPGYIAWGEGGTFDRAVYPALATWLDTNGPSLGLSAPQIAAGTIPDWRDYVPRTAGGALGPAVGVKQSDQIAAHTHNISLSGIQTVITSGSGQGTVSYGAGPAINQPDTPGNRNASGDNLGAIWPTGGAETRVKSFGVRWQIKAYGALVNQGTADLVAIEAGYALLTNAAVRDDVDQSAQSKAVANKVNILKNTLQRWEVLEDVDASSIASYVRTDLAAYSDFTIEGVIRGATTGTYPIWQLSTDNGATYDTTNNYSRSFNAALSSGNNSGIVGTDAGFIMYGDGHNDGDYGGLAFRMTITDFNVPSRTRWFANGIFYTAAGSLIGVTSTGMRNTPGAQNAFRIFMSSGNMADARFLLMGKRG